MHRHIEAELHGTTKESDQLLAQDLPTLNDSLKSKGRQPIEPPQTKVGANDATNGSDGVVGKTASLPADFHISW